MNNRRAWTIFTWTVALILLWFMMSAVAMTTFAMHQWYKGIHCAAGHTGKAIQRRLTLETPTPNP